MSHDDSALDEDIGEATIVYDGPDGDPIEREIPNEHIAYFQDHWILKTDTDERGRDTIRRVPAQRVYYVERSVEEFEEEVKTIKDRFESVADELRTLLPGGGRGRGSGGGGEGDDGGVYHIDVDAGEPSFEDGDESGASGEYDDASGRSEYDDTADRDDGSDGSAGSDDEGR